ncbi:MAG: hypothetical protein NTW21_26805 [Verrucomicrobia bacterium]|nr:hypothetical protein [Verrucomicrobiota bacterium]
MNALSNADRAVRVRLDLTPASGGAGTPVVDAFRITAAQANGTPGK